ncbi:MAG: hypothetical protein A3I44_04370 [Candidatus Sungbacteria bacterium RIFCSPLOWO2_02_FULL_51_17]|uniref:Uncharacterized protein n=1 Tax=Candidatus Sungbacteria bacterium RIFCSPHIGHO2_02_FULL_51_29 TaxID=1802273 RepID=A0A1G2KZ09_9BACT|nr:MAG: hypothetical protein A2676_05860 [Candidatus Sungbacteria bacterium RIFCSPHIGHO2_01_FULL_51_22]OHA03669.1 MAG: hypothetical protein A3C16_03460 [Candidatus Sungbacteria bacterium RIFCSPHIGHO2_02_FULL_51_29]OHA11310.1 MAG: hypothetical protein A3I44_04370 [Candidatus Sungbacteria bacterium RIFCSPLOWO2_02_FULL_51_17]
MEMASLLGQLMLYTILLAGIMSLPTFLLYKVFPRFPPPVGLFSWKIFFWVTLTQVLLFESRALTMSGEVLPMLLLHIFIIILSVLIGAAAAVFTALLIRLSPGKWSV